MSDERSDDGIDLGLPGAAVVFSILGWLFHRDDRDSPEMAITGPEVEAVLKLAHELVLADRLDLPAARQLRAKAGKRKVLRRSEKASRLMGRHHEFRHQNAVQRLLAAALNDCPVAPMTEGDVRRAAAVEGLAALPNAERWRALCEREPRLRELEAEVRPGGFGAADSVSSEGIRSEARVIGYDSQEWRQVTYESDPDDDIPLDIDAMRRSFRDSHRLHSRVAGLVGPKASGDREDVLIGTRYAQAVADAHLSRLRPAAD